MPKSVFEPKLGHLRDKGGSQPNRHVSRVLAALGKAGRASPWSKGHVRSTDIKRGFAASTRVSAGYIATGHRRVIVRARYARASKTGAETFRAHINYILRDGTTRDGERGQLYSRDQDIANRKAFLDRSIDDPHQFRFIVSAEDSARLADLKPFVRDLMAQMEQDLGTRLDWVAVDHFNTGHPHTHIVVRGKEENGQNLIIARDYISHGVRARAQALVTLELGPESQLEQFRKLGAEVELERFTRLDRSLFDLATDNVAAIADLRRLEPERQTLAVARLGKLSRLGLAAERRSGVWKIAPEADKQLRALGDRADKIKMMQRALADSGISRSASRFAVFAKGPIKKTIVGRVLGTGFVDEITDRRYVVLDGTDGRVHYVELGRMHGLQPPGQEMLIQVGSRSQTRPSATPQTMILSQIPHQHLVRYEGPTCLDQFLLGKHPPETMASGFATQLNDALEKRLAWLERQGLAERSKDGQVTLKPRLLSALRVREGANLQSRITREFGERPQWAERGTKVHGVYERSIDLATRRIAVIRSDVGIVLAPWRTNLESYRGRAVTGDLQRSRVTWKLAPGRGLSR